MDTILRDLERVDQVIGSIQTESVRDRFEGLIAELHVELYEKLSPEDQETVLRGIHQHEMEKNGWEVDEELRSGGWSALIYQHRMWGHWRVEIYSPRHRIEEWDARFDGHMEAREYALRWVSSSTRPWS